jgi:hypothetical protein
MKATLISILILLSMVVFAQKEIQLKNKITGDSLKMNVKLSEDLQQQTEKTKQLYKSKLSSNIKMIWYDKYNPDSVQFLIDGKPVQLWTNIYAAYHLNEYYKQQRMSNIFEISGFGLLTSSVLFLNNPDGLKTVTITGSILTLVGWVIDKTSTSKLKKASRALSGVIDIEE